MNPMKVTKVLTQKWDTISPIAVPILCAFSFSWVETGLNGDALFANWFPALEQHKIWTLLAVISLFVWSSWWIYDHRQRYLPVRSLETGMQAARLPRPYGIHAESSAASGSGSRAIPTVHAVWQDHNLHR